MDDDLQIDDQKAALWNNLAFSLIEQGKRQESLEAIAEAIRLDPDNTSYKNSQQEIRNW